VVPILEVVNVTAGYPRNVVLKDISFNVAPGEILGIIGPNGCGKSTLLRTITSILKPFGGKVLFHGQNIREFSYRRIARYMAVVSQDTDLTFSFRAVDVVMMGRLPHLGRIRREGREDFSVVERCLRLMDVSDIAERQITELSSGERQRVMIAKALAQEPEVLLLDEPTSHLDIGHQIEIFDLIKELNKNNGLTILCVLHDLNLAAEYCSRLILMKTGGIYSIGPPEEVLRYDIIEHVYKTVVVVLKNPTSGKPHVVLVPGTMLSGDKMESGKDH
jgi:iron complex transport system ATP-binding protein